jgi:hypothetical protein
MTLLQFSNSNKNDLNGSQLGKIADNGVTRMIMRTSNESQESVVHICNPSYSGARDQEDCCMKSAQIVLWDPISNTPSQK